MASVSGIAHGPNVCFVSAAKLPFLNPKRRVRRCVPDLAVEILSENDRFVALMKKAVRMDKPGIRLSPVRHEAVSLRRFDRLWSLQ